MLHATLIGPGLTLGVGGGGAGGGGGLGRRGGSVFKQPGILGCESRSEEGGGGGGGVGEGVGCWRMWRPGVSLIIMDALLDESSQDMFA